MLLYGIERLKKIIKVRFIPVNHFVHARIIFLKRILEVFRHGHIKTARVGVVVIDSALLKVSGLMFCYLFKKIEVFKALLTMVGMIDLMDVI